MKDVIVETYNSMMISEVKGRQVNRVIDKIKSLGKWNDEDLEEDWMIAELGKSIGVVLTPKELEQIHARYEFEMERKYKPKRK